MGSKERVPGYIEPVNQRRNIEYGEKVTEFGNEDMGGEEAVIEYDPQIYVDRERRIAYCRGIALVHVKSIKFKDFNSTDLEIVLLGYLSLVVLSCIDTSNTAQVQQFSVHVSA